MSQAELFFRGDRNYVHSVEILHWVLYNIYGEWKKDFPRAFEFVISQKCNTKLILSDYSDSIKDNIVATYRDGSQHKLVIASGEKVVAVGSDFNPEMKEYFRVTDKTVHVDFAGIAEDFFTQAVSAFKFLLLSPGVFIKAQKYSFCKINIEDMPSASFTITFTRVIGGKFFEGIIKAEDRPLGAIYFAQE